MSKTLTLGPTKFKKLQQFQFWHFLSQIFKNRTFLKGPLCPNYWPHSVPLWIFLKHCSRGFQNGKKLGCETYGSWEINIHACFNCYPIDCSAHRWQHQINMKMGYSRVTINFQEFLVQVSYRTLKVDFTKVHLFCQYFTSFYFLNCSYKWQFEYK